jgi:hypothetical protein
MRQADRNFKRRFGDRISMVFSEKRLSPAEQKIHNDALCRAIREVMAGILKREPTEAEMFGIEDISVHKRRRKERLNSNK